MRPDEPKRPGIERLLEHPGIALAGVGRDADERHDIRL
jgi:hypothetical protein